MEEIKQLLEKRISELSAEINKALDMVGTKQAEMKRLKSSLAILDNQEKPRKAYSSRAGKDTYTSLCEKAARGKATFKTTDILAYLEANGHYENVPRRQKVKYISQALGSIRSPFERVGMDGKNVIYRGLPLEAEPGITRILSEGH